MKPTKKLSQTQLALSALRTVDLIRQDQLKQRDAAVQTLLANQLVRIAEPNTGGMLCPKT